MIGYERCAIEAALAWLTVDRATVPDTEAASERLVEGYVARAAAAV